MKNVLITGGVHGLGYHLCDYYAKNDSHVTVLDIEYKEPENNIEYIQFDLADFDEGKLRYLNTAFDIVICNAGISISGDYKEIPFENEEKVFSINVFGHMRLIKCLLKHRFFNKGGRIVFICSASVYLPFPIALAYSASKSALDGFAHALEAYTVPKDISITRVYPGPMDTSHRKYYPEAQEGGRPPQDSVLAIVKGIEKRKRKVFPDPLSRMYRFSSKLMPKKLCRRTFDFYKDRIQ